MILSENKSKKDWKNALLLCALMLAIFSTLNLLTNLKFYFDDDLNLFPLFEPVGALYAISLPFLAYFLNTYSGL